MLERIAERLRPQRRLLVIVTIVGAVAISVAERDYGKLQTAENADRFRQILGDDDGTFIAAAIADLCFAAAYGIGAFAITVKHRLSLIGAATLFLGGVFDELENVLVLRNINSADSVGDRAVDVMRTLGYVKWTLSIAGLVLLLAGYVAHRRERQSSA